MKPNHWRLLSATRSEAQVKIQIDETTLWHIRDLIHHFGIHHPTVKGTPVGCDLASIGNCIPALARCEPVGGIRELEAIFHRHGWNDQAITLESALDLADSLIGMRVKPLHSW